MVTSCRILFGAACVVCLPCVIRSGDTLCVHSMIPSSLSHDSSSFLSHDSCPSCHMTSTVLESCSSSSMSYLVAWSSAPLSSMSHNLVSLHPHCPPPRPIHVTWSTCTCSIPTSDPCRGVPTETECAETQVCSPHIMITGLAQLSNNFSWSGVPPSCHMTSHDLSSSSRLHCLEESEVCHTIGARVHPELQKSAELLQESWRGQGEF